MCGSHNNGKAKYKSKIMNSLIMKFSKLDIFSSLRSLLPLPLKVHFAFLRARFVARTILTV